MTIGCQLCNTTNGFYPVVFTREKLGVDVMICGNLDWYDTDYL